MTDSARAERPRVAIIGAGVSGLVTAYLLRKTHDVHVYEAAAHIGGHTNTRDVNWQGSEHAIDTGFIVFNRRTYPLFCQLLHELGVATQPSDMGFSVRDDRSGLEYAGRNLDTLFAQRKNLLRPGFYRMLRDILRFGRESLALLADNAADLTLGQYLQQARYSQRFVEHYLVPMGAAIWSTPPSRMLEFPARTFVRFFHNHGMLTVADRPQWYVVRGGSREYVRALVRELPNGVRTECAVSRIERDAAAVTVHSDRAPSERYDSVVIATHSDVALRLLAVPSEDETQILGAIPYQRNDAVLHVDDSLMPRRKRVWSAWNSHLGVDSERRVALTYDMNILQSITGPQHFFVTLNRDTAIDSSRVIERFAYEHPVFTRAGIAAQARVDRISGVGRTYYCGAYWGYGFHEDGVRSAVAVARKFGSTWGDAVSAERANAAS